MQHASNTAPSRSLSQKFSYAKRQFLRLAPMLAGAFSAGAIISYVQAERSASYDTQYPEIKNAPLTTGEAELVRAVFGPAFDTATIRKSYRANEAACGTPTNAEATYSACVTRGSSTIKFANAAAFMDDYSRDGNSMGSRTSTFMHEVTHIWQNRTDAPNSGRCHDYGLPPEAIMSPTLTFDNLCTERQAELIGNYAAIFLRPSTIGLPSGGEYDAYFDRIRALVEDKFPHAASTRATMQQRTRDWYACFRAAADSTPAQRLCNARYYTNLQGTTLSTTAREITFTLPDGTVTHPLVEAQQRVARAPAAPSS